MLGISSWGQRERHDLSLAELNPHQTGVCNVLVSVSIRLQKACPLAKLSTLQLSDLRDSEEAERIPAQMRRLCLWVLRSRALGRGFTRHCGKG